MSTLDLRRRPASSTRTLDQPTRDQRCIINALDEQSLPITEQNLAAVLTATRWRDRSTGEVRTRLHHVDLPKLAEEGYVSWDESEAIVTSVDAPTTADDRSVDADGDLDGLEGEIRVVSNLIETLDGPQHETDLAHGLAAITESSDPDSDLVEKMAIEVRHRYLPKLDQAGLVEYDPDDGMVAATDSPE